MITVKANEIIPYINAICKQNIKAVANNPVVNIDMAEKLCDKYKMDATTKNELLAYLYLGVTNKALKKRVEALEKELAEANEKLLQLDREWVEYDAQREAAWNKYADEMQVWIEQMPRMPEPSEVAATDSVDEEVEEVKVDEVEHDEEPADYLEDVLDNPEELKAQQETIDTLVADSIKNKGYWSEEQYKQVKAEAEAKGLPPDNLLPF